MAENGKYCRCLVYLRLSSWSPWSFQFSLCYNHGPYQSIKAIYTLINMGTYPSSILRSFAIQLLSVTPFLITEVKKESSDENPKGCWFGGGGNCCTNGICGSLYFNTGNGGASSRDRTSICERKPGKTHFSYMWSPQ